MKRVFAPDAECTSKTTGMPQTAASRTSKRRASWCVSSQSDPAISAFYAQQRLPRPSSDVGSPHYQDALESDLPALDALLTDMLEGYPLALDAYPDCMPVSPIADCGDLMRGDSLMPPLCVAADGPPSCWVDALLDQLAVTPCDEALLSPALSGNSATSSPASGAAGSPMAANTPPQATSPSAVAPGTPPPPQLPVPCTSGSGSEAAATSAPCGADFLATRLASVVSTAQTPPPQLDMSYSAPAPAAAACLSARSPAAVPLLQATHSAPVVGTGPPLLCAVGAAPRSGLDAPTAKSSGMQDAKAPAAYVQGACGTAHLAALAAARQQRLRALQTQAARAGDTEEGVQLRQQLALALRRRATAEGAWANAGGAAAAPAARAAKPSHSGGGAAGAAGAAGANLKVFRPRRSQEESAARTADPRGGGGARASSAPAPPMRAAIFPHRAQAVVYVPPAQLQVYLQRCRFVREC